MPKIPIQNIYYILCYAWGMGDLRNKLAVGVEKCDSVLNLLVHLLLNATEKIVKRGVSCDYRPCVEDIDGVKGKVNIANSLKSGKMNLRKLNCEFDEYSSDITINRIIFSSLLQSLKIRDLSIVNKNRLRKTIRSFPKVKPIQQINESLFRGIKYNRNNSYYGLALNLCRLLCNSLLPREEQTGKFSFLDFVDDERAMNRIFERFLMNFYQQECKDAFPQVNRSCIRFQLTPYGITCFEEYQSALHLLPFMETDVTLYNPQTKKKIIIDAKYYKEMLQSKYGNNGKLRREHLSQILSYVMNQELTQLQSTMEAKGILVYAVDDQERDISYSYKDTKHLIQVSTINLNQDWQSIEKRLKAIIS